MISLAVVSTTGSLVFLGLNPRDCGNNGNKTDQIEPRSHDPPPGQSDRDRVRLIDFHSSNFEIETGVIVVHFWKNVNFQRNFSDNIIFGAKLMLYVKHVLLSFY